MVSRHKRRKSKFLDRYELENRLLRKASVQEGRPALVSGFDLRTGDQIVIKEWRIEKVVDQSDLREIWRHEVRQLLRVSASPGAREYIANLKESDEDEDGFYLVLNTGQKLPLAHIRKSKNKPSWLSFPKLETSRQVVWQNLERIALGLGILHNQGILHRDLDEWSIFASGSDVADFQLSGFEWTLRLISKEGASSKPRSRIKAKDGQEIYSFDDDWAAFGRIACSLLEVDPKEVLTGTSRQSSSTSGHLLSLERNLLRSLLLKDPFEQVDADFVSNRVGSIIENIGLVASSKNARLYLTCRLGQNSMLSTAIREASGRALDINDLSGQLDFVLADLYDDPILYLVSDARTSAQRYVLQGRTLTYRLTPYAPQGPSQPSWDVAFCDVVEKFMPDSNRVLGQVNLYQAEIEVVSFVEIRKRFSRIMGKSARWDHQIPAPESLDETRSKNTYRAFLIVQILEALQLVSNIWPVKILKSEVTDAGAKLYLQARTDAQGDLLGKCLGLGKSSARMKEAFRNESIQIDSDWLLSDFGGIGGWRTVVEKWSFVELEEEVGQQVSFVFESATALIPSDENLFLRQSDFAGHDRLLRRRIKALGELSENVELLEMLDDPRITLRSSHEEPPPLDELGDLSESKKKALQAVWKTLPIFLVQGPPGVGKTRLVRELVVRYLKEEPTSRLLLTAQSHSAVDHLMSEIEKLVVEEDLDEPLIVRSRPREKSAGKSQFELRKQSNRLLRELVDSDLVKQAEPKLRARVLELSKTLEKPESIELDPDEDQDIDQPIRLDRSLEDLLLRSANMVFATSNSGDLERMVLERAHCDWSIVEEAGKATGVDLVPALLLSHRRILIGDHKQLPPFGAGQLLKILQNPSNVREAIELSGDLIGGPFKDAGLSDLSDALGDEDSLAQACSEAAQITELFKSIIETEFDEKNENGGIPIGLTLSEQYRMHPSIAELISKTYYNQAVKTDEDRVRYFATSEPPFTILDEEQLPNSPIVFVDLPYIQGKVGKNVGETVPRYTNSDEVDAVVDIMGLIKAEPTKQASLAVLSPYRRQVKLLNDRIFSEREDKLKNIDEFEHVGQEDALVSTVDSFQGNEADIVIVSFVRNNQFSGLKALGFLADSRRMNVLLSRAKWKLILVGSFDFLKGRFELKKSNANEEMESLKELIENLETMTSEKTDCGKPKVTFVRPQRFWA